MNCSLEKETHNDHNDRSYNDRRRTIRIKRSGLKHANLEHLDRPSLKFAETKDELEQSFQLVYNVYKAKGFASYNENGMIYNIHSLLPSTTHVIAKSYKSVISNLTEMFDNKYFGLPIDQLYKEEMDVLRNEERKIVELTSLATPREHRWKNIFQYLVQIVYWYALYSEVDDICISINPKHVRFYKYLFPFEEFGPKRHYERVGAPAVGLRVRVKEIVGRMQEIRKDLNFETPLDEYFDKFDSNVSQEDISDETTNNLEIAMQKRLDYPTVQYFLNLNLEVLSGLNEQQKNKLLEYYPGLQLPDF